MSDKTDKTKTTEEESCYLCKVKIEGDAIWTIINGKILPFCKSCIEKLDAEYDKKAA